MKLEEYVRALDCSLPFHINEVIHIPSAVPSSACGELLFQTRCSIEDKVLPSYGASTV